MAAESDHSNYVDDEEIQGGRGTPIPINTIAVAFIKIQPSCHQSISFSLPSEGTQRQCQYTAEINITNISHKQAQKRFFRGSFQVKGLDEENESLTEEERGERVLWTSGTKTLFTCASIYFSSLMCLSGFTQFRENICNSNFVFALSIWLTFPKHQYIWKCANQLNYIFVKFTYTGFKSEKITPKNKKKHVVSFM